MTSELQTMHDFGQVLQMSGAEIVSLTERTDLDLQSIASEFTVIADRVTSALLTLLREHQPGFPDPRDGAT